MKKSKILITMIIIVLLVFAGFSAYAADNDKVTQESEPKKLNEIVEKRTLTSKAYAMSDGTVRHEMFATNIHYKDDGGKLKDIDIKVKDMGAVSQDGQRYDLWNKEVIHKILDQPDKRCDRRRQYDHIRLFRHVFVQQ